MVVLPVAFCPTRAIGERSVRLAIESGRNSSMRGAFSGPAINPLAIGGESVRVLCDPLGRRGGAIAR